MTAGRARLAGAGRLAVPAGFRRGLRLAPGEGLVPDIQDGELRACSLRRAGERAQALVRPCVSAGTRLAEEVTGQRRTGAGRD